MISSFLGGIFENLNIIAGGNKANNYQLGSDLSNISEIGTIGRLGANSVNVARDFTNIYIKTLYASEMYRVLNQKAYATSKLVETTGEDLEKIFYGPVLISIDSDNDEFVKDTINFTGYEVYKYLDDISLIDLNNVDYILSKNINYNVVSFSMINIYGEFPRDIANIFNAIFETGVKIWYDYQMNSDNYVI